MIESVFGLFKATSAAFNDTSKLLHLQLRGLGDEGDDSKAEQVDDATVLSSFGLAVKPIVQATLRALAIRYGTEIWPIKIWDKTKLATDLEDGETRLYGVGEKASRVRCRGNGDIDVEAKDGQVLTIKANNATIVIDANGGVTVKPASGQVLSLGDDASSAHFIIGNGETLKSALDSLKSAVDSLRTDMSTVKSHTHTTTCTAGGASVPLSGDLTTIPTGSAPDSIPAHSTVVKAV